MKFVELETDYFFSSIESEVQHQTIAEFLRNRDVYNFVLLDGSKMMLSDVEKICCIADSRTILFYNASFGEEQILNKGGHFNIQKFVDGQTSSNCLKQLECAFFLGQHAGFIAPNEFAIIPSSLPGEVQRFGCYALVVEGNFGTEFQNACIWEGIFETWYVANNPLRRLWGGETYDLEFDYDKIGNIEYEFILILKYPSGIKEKIRWSEKSKRVTIPENVKLSLALRIRGEGKLNIKKIYMRRTRLGVGTFIPGDQFTIAKNGEKIWYYYFPGKDPEKLIISFTGALNEISKFEYLSLKEIGYSVLFFLDERARGGVFQLGENLNTSYEESIKSIIKKYQNKLKLGNKQLIFNGYSMGSFPALYYGSIFEAGNIIVSKPIVNLGSVTSNSELIAKTDGTMIEARLFLTGRTDKQDTNKLDSYYFNKVKELNLKEVNLYVFSLLNDELDRDAVVYLEKLANKNFFKLEKNVVLTGYHRDRRYEMKKFIFSTLNKIKEE